TDRFLARATCDARRVHPSLYGGSTLLWTRLPGIVDNSPRRCSWQDDGRPWVLSRSRSPLMADSSPGTDAGTGDDSPKLSGPTVKYMAKRVLSEFLRDGGTDQAAKLTYFMVLSIAPTLLALFSLATLLLAGIKDQIADLLVDAINSAAGGSGLGAEDAVRSTVGSLMGSSTGGTVALIIGIATALWSASAYIKAYGRVANHIYEVPEGRGPIRM